ncbi:hypothetical protein [Streptomyces sp. KMM 9044]|uniref:hypothetical protein n=1 Tax=Streptomyces sp. KMM 9044 TaxID=2744474 RepID=UPI002151B473|nr:hypothetical protein [Streptomyces sp. KMM 9044]WAX80042.1 hypothetical protein HUV60_022630 [Streptomyces sp. KMM 9044]
MSVHDDDRNNAAEGEGGTEYDALMAAILDEPLSAAARRDPAFMAAREAAVTDVAVLRQQLGLIGETLAAVGTPAARGEAVGPGAGGPEAAPAAGTGTSAAPGGSPAAGPRAPVTPLPSRRVPRRPPRVALGALAAAAGASVVLGTGWLVTGSGQGDTASSAAESADRAADAKRSTGAGDPAGVLFGSPRYLACARLVAEGTVAEVEPVPGAGRDRVTLEVTRGYKPEPGTKPGDRGEVTFLTGAPGRPRLHTGDRVLVGLPHEGTVPDAVVVGEEDIAPERARITAALPASRTLACE